ncbi:MAG: nucleotide exchange factor GrpE [Alphaproteobacteria bacterium]|nr:nucleotide exchange factor GrpE [Alphaproteobacteria bacterium]
MSEPPKPSNDDVDKEPAAPADVYGDVPGGDAAVDGDPRVAALEAEIAKLKDQLLRTLADGENLRRRTEREREDTSKYAASKFAGDVVSVADNLRRALDSIPADAKTADGPVKTLVAGIELTEREMLAALAKHGVQKVDPLGEKFDYNRHQAMFEVENTGKPAGTVVQVLQAGYVIHDRLLRPAMVGVAKGSAEQAPSARVDTTA